MSSCARCYYLMKYNQKPPHIPIGPSTGKLGRQDYQKNAKSHICDQGIFSHRQLRINYDKLYDVYQLDALAKNTTKNMQSIPFAFKYQNADLQQDSTTVSCSTICQLCLGRPIQQERKEIKSNMLQKSKKREILSNKFNQDDEDISEIQKLLELEENNHVYSTPIITSSISSDPTVFYTCNDDNSSNKLSEIQEVDETNINTTRT